MNCWGVGKTHSVGEGQSFRQKVPKMIEHLEVFQRNLFVFTIGIVTAKNGPGIVFLLLLLLSVCVSRMRSGIYTKRGVTCG